MLSKWKGFAQIDFLLWLMAMLSLILIITTTALHFVIPLIHDYELTDYARQNFSALENYYWENVGSTQCYSPPSAPSMSTLISGNYLSSDASVDSSFYGTSPTYRYITNTAGIFPVAFEIDVTYINAIDANYEINNQFFKAKDGNKITLQMPFDTADLDPDVMAFIDSSGCM